MYSSTFNLPKVKGFKTKNGFQSSGSVFKSIEHKCANEYILNLLITNETQQILREDTIFMLGKILITDTQKYTYCVIKM
jgi:hypothetical protein